MVYSIYVYGTILLYGVCTQRCALSASCWGQSLSRCAWGLKPHITFLLLECYSKSCGIFMAKRGEICSIFLYLHPSPNFRLLFLCTAPDAAYLASCSPPSFPLCGNDIKGPVLVSTFFLPSESARTNEQRTLLDSIDVLIYNQSYNFDTYLWKNVICQIIHGWNNLSDG